MSVRQTIPVLIFFTLLWIVDADAAIYKWKDENGEVFTDVSQRYEVAIEVGEGWVNLNTHSTFAVIDLIKWLLINTDQKAIFTEYDGFVNIQDAKTMGLVK